MSSLPPALDFPAMEEEIVEKWKREDTFRTQNQLSLDRGDKRYTFYDGPPFATGLPHYGHILAGTIKDIVTRYAALTGHYVERRAGWDCHGLPVEYEIDQKLGITHRDQVLEMGIDKYNATCRSIVTRYTSEWKATITRLGRWIDFENDYKTMDASFMESVWWVFSQLFAKNLVYQGYKVMPYSTACTTPLSNFEAGLNYKNVNDPAIVVLFAVVEKDGKTRVEPATYLTAWTTTPWTLPSNVALCVHPELSYCLIQDKATSKRIYVAKSRLVQLYPVMATKKWKPEKASELYEIVQDNIVGKDLVGTRYRPLFDYFAQSEWADEHYFRVLMDTYVTDDAGTGIVHQAPAFGEDDYRVCLAHGVIVKGGGSNIPCPVDASGNFTEPVSLVLGMHVKKADETIIAHLKDEGTLWHKGVLEHSYPFCWRSDTPLIYKAVPSWFVKVEEIRDQIVANNQSTYWVPAEVQTGRFHNWLVDARDWAVSRNRFWGTPIPIWASDDLSEMVCIGSIQELADKSGLPPVTDLHRESIDHIEIPSQQNPNGPKLKRTEEVFDCWFESGSMPYAQSHYPFENAETWEQGFPADFIAEGIDQTRGWFYTLMVLSTALFGKPAFQNNITSGMVLASDGQKMSKRLKNYPDPTVVIKKYGADALRLYLVNSPVVRAESLKFREEGVLSVVKEVFLPLYNAFRFFIQNMERWEHGNKDGKKFVPNDEKRSQSTNPTDIWIQAETQGLIKFVHEEMQAYRLYTVMPALVRFGGQLTNWYVRLNRDRLKGLEGEGQEAEQEAETGLQVLYNVLLDVTVIMAPFTPFIAEFFYQHLRKLEPSYNPNPEDPKYGSSNPVQAGKSDSVHYLMLPTYDEGRLNAEAVEAMQSLQSVVEQGRYAREKRNISLRTPVKTVVAILRNPAPHVVESLTGPLKSYILSELNAWEFTVVPKEEERNWIKLSLTPNFKILGKKLGKQMQAVKAQVNALTHEEAVQCLDSGELRVEGGAVLDCATEVEAKLDFAREGDHWEPAVKPDGSLVVAVDCTQDEAILTAGMARELINAIQQLRKTAGLDLMDVVEVFFDEGGDVGGEVASTKEVEQVVARNVNLFQAKFKGIAPLPKRYQPPYAVAIATEPELQVGSTTISLSLTRPALAVRDDLDPILVKVLSTMEPIASLSNNGNTPAESGGTLHLTVDDKAFTVQEGVDYWKSAMAKVQATTKLMQTNSFD
ncbi:hypothetical protein ACA910_003356 [Epithemia clementina (nom. ined.)]